MTSSPPTAVVRTAAELLRRWIGLDVATMGLAALERAVRARMESVGEPDPSAFAQRLVTDTDERDRLVEEIVVAESWFFRDARVFEVLRRFAAARTRLPERRPLRVLCVPCAAGEEPYSVAMALLEEGLPESWFSIDALDVSRRALARAAAATYHANAFRNVDLRFRDRWFRQEGAAALLDDKVRRSVNFAWGNILDDAFLAGRECYDVVFCRNLLMYLTADARSHVERVLDRLLAVDGLLVLGAAEPPILRGPWVPAAEHASFTLLRDPRARAASAPSPPTRPRSPSGAGPSAPPPRGPRLRAQGGRMIEPVVTSQNVTPPPAECWRRIGVSGDRSCPELKEFIHCRNCPVLADAARAFFDRPAPEGYLESWRHVLEQSETETDRQATSVLVFRIGAEWLALPTAVLGEISLPRRLHHLPHREGDILEGLVNIRGQLQLCVSLDVLLGLERRSVPDAGDDRRLLVVERRGACWVFTVDAVAGVQRVTRSSLRAVPSTVSAAACGATIALFDAHGRTVGLLDEARLLDGLCERVRE